MKGTEREVKEHIEKVIKESRKKGLCINCKTIEYIVIGGERVQNAKDKINIKR